MKTRPTTDFRHFQYFHRGLRWIRIFAGVIEEWRPAANEWVFVDRGNAPGPAWKEFTEADQLKEELAACSAMVHTLETRVAEQRETIKRQRAKNSALRKERWEAKRSAMFDMTAHHSELPLRPLAWKHKEPAPAPVETRRWYHRDDGFTNGVKYFEIRNGQVFTDQGAANSHTVRAWEYASKNFVPDGLWIEVRGTNIPSDLPKPPALPKGFTHWEYHTKWDTSGDRDYTYFDGYRWISINGRPAGLFTHYLEAKGGASEAPREGHDVGGLKSFLTEVMLDEAIANAASARQAVFAAPKIKGLESRVYPDTVMKSDLIGSIDFTKPFVVPKTRIFRHKTGFRDTTDYVEIKGNKVTFVQKDGRRHAPLFYTVADVERYAAAGIWVEVFDSPSPLRANVQRMAEVVAKEFDLARWETVHAALVHRFGYLPDMTTRQQHLHKVIDHNKVEHWLWLDKPLQIGEKAPLNKAICRINPPSFGPYGNPQS